MRNVFFFIICIVFIFFHNSIFAQADREFWFAAPAVTAGHENKPLRLRFSSYSKPTNIVVTQPANPLFVPVTISLNANSATTVDITNQIEQIENKPVNTILNFGLKITATEPVSAYYEVGERLNPEIFPLKGNSGLGLSFLIPSQTRFDNRHPLVPIARSGFVVVATEDSTVVTIHLTNDDVAGHTANAAFTITLQKGQSYAVAAASHLASKRLGGSAVKSNKTIAVTIYDDSVLLGTNHDLVGDQIVPEINTGVEFIVVRGALSFSAFPGRDLYYVWATENNTEIKESGIVVATINRGQSYEGSFSSSNVYIQTNKPVYVFQFTGIGQEVTGTSLPSIKCTGSSNVSFVRSTNETFFLNLLCKSQDVGSFLINGVAGIINPNIFEDVVGTNGVWKSARISTSNLPNINSVIPAGVTTQISNSTGLFHVGFINGEDRVGTRIGYFSNYKILDLDAAVLSNQCSGSDIQLMVANQSNTSYNWTGPNGFGSSVYNPVIINASSNNNGTYYVKVQVQGCGEYIDSLKINIGEKPTASFAKNDTICIGSSSTVPITFKGKSPWSIIISDGIKNDTIRNIQTSPYLFSTSPKINTTYTILNVIDSALCVAAIPQNSPQSQTTITVNQLPTYNIRKIDSVCRGITKNWNIQLTGKPPFSLEYTDGISNYKIDTISGLTLSIPINPLNTTTYTITKITDANGCSNMQRDSTIVYVFSRPTVSINAPREICLSDSILFTFSANTFGDNISRINWNFGDNTFGSKDSVVKKYLTASTYNVQLTIQTTVGCSSDTVIMSSVVHPLPV
ncbi:MAG: PKD domain-containing protein, partial [Chitinophagaceae bacterium]